MNEVLVIIILIAIGMAVVSLIGHVLNSNPPEF
jgi:hypothetical protein